MPQPIARRVENLRRRMKDKQLETLMVLVAENRRYLSGFSAEDTQFDESAGALFVSADRLLLATDSRFELQARQEAPDFEIFCYRKGLAESLPEISQMLGAKHLAFESARLSVAEHTKITRILQEAPRSPELVPAEDIVEALRVIKDEGEIAALKQALALAESAFEDFVARLRSGMSEAEIAWAMERGLREAGAEALSFPTIVASGPNSALPHAVPQDRPVRGNEPILFDWGARLAGYCSDISRTLVIGDPDETFRKVHRTVAQAQQRAIAALRPGASSKAVDAAARGHIAEMGFEGKFGHGLGHGTGLAVHEQPRLSPLKDTPLEPGMVFTVEPGIYLPGWGGVRLENMVVVREQGAEVLNRLPLGYTLDGGALRVGAEAGLSR